MDGSDASQTALEQAVWLARHANAVLTGFYILDTGWADFIGNDWQSSDGARRGFLDHIGKEQTSQAELARLQFETAVQGLAQAQFIVLTGDPIRVLVERLNDPRSDLLVFGRKTFQVSGRPSLKTAAQSLVKQGRKPVLLLP
ncbi:MAG TPA: universal stress protein [Polyangiaceae bacterium]|nr:universal stress protein [Polyangiaceae bacterium]HPY20156.1 universal stress protein [Polyangiaceae bacterium]HQM11827.1 universal stress protein [Polyangiaceae bacterium]